MQYIQKRKNDTYFGQMTETSQREKKKDRKVLLAPHDGAAKPGRRCISRHPVLGRPLGPISMDVANMTRLINLWGTIVKRLNRCGWDIFIRSSSTSGNKFFTKIVSLSLALKIAYVKSLPKFHDHRWRSEQRPIRKLKAMRCLRTPVLWPWNDQAQICVRPVIFVRLPSLVNNTPTPTTHERSWKQQGNLLCRTGTDQPLTFPLFWSPCMLVHSLCLCLCFPPLWKHPYYLARLFRPF